MKKAHYENGTKKLLGFYDTKIHKTIPTPNISVSESVWKEAINKNFNCVDVETKTLSKKDFRTQVEIDLENATQYQRDRAAEYAKLNQFEMQFDDEINGTTTWKDAILAIKAQFPKP